MEYILKNGEKISSIPIGKSSVIIGEQYGYLTVCDRGPAPKSGSGATVICKCKCGNYTWSKLNSLKTGSTLSCGCYGREKASENCKKIGQRQYYKDYTKIDNPFYTFIKPYVYNEELNSMLWEIQCKNCGKTFYEVPSQIVSYKRKRGNNPCDCWHFKSKGILKIDNILNENHIAYEKEKSFKDCVSPKGNQLRFDYFLPEQNILIEYDGEQHFKPVSFGGLLDGKLRLTIQKEYDKIKNDWCKKNNYILIRIPYTQFKDLTINDLLNRKE